jgi:O-antigen ligase
MNIVMQVIIVLVIAGLAFRGISKPFAGLLGLLVVYIVQPGELYPTLAPLHLERTLAVFVLLSFFLHGNKLRFPPATKWFLAFYGAMVVSIPLAFWRGNSIQFCISFVEIVVFHLLVVAMLTTEERIKKFVVLTVALTGWLAGTALLLYAQGVRIVTMGIERSSGITSSGGDPNTLGITLVTAMPLEFLMMSKGNEKWIRLLGLGVFLISLETIITTGSRTSFFAVMFLVLLLILFDFKRKAKFLPLLVVALPLLWLVIPEQYKARYETVDNLKDDDSYQNRVLSWEGGVQMFLHNPLTGVGPDNYTDANGMKYWPGVPRHWLNAHSLFFKLIGELGIVGVITFGGYLVCLIGTNHRLARQWKDRGGSVLVQKFPIYCNMSLYLLLMTGYSAHNLYRSTWFILGAVSGAASLLQVSHGTIAAIAEKKPVLGAWVPGAEDASPQLEVVTPWRG